MNNIEIVDSSCALPRYSGTELHTDSSAVGFHAVLLQRQDDDKLHPVSYFSKSMTASEASCHSFELETLTVVYALELLELSLL